MNLHQKRLLPHLNLWIACLASLWLACPTALAGETTARKLTAGSPVEAGVAPSRLADAMSIVRHAVADQEIPGAVVLVARRGRVILHEAVGWRDVECQKPMATDSLFRMASNSKALTAAGIMRLVDEERLGLDDPVGKWLPAFDNESWSGVTLRHLLTHTSGSRIKPLFLRPLLTKSAEHPQAPDLLLEVSRFADIAPKHPPGATYSYNNAGYNMLAGVIEAVTGSYKQHLREQIYEPLGMADCCNHESAADHSRMSTVMKRQADGSWQAGWTPGDPPDWPFPRGSGGMVASAWDYAVFCQMLLNRGLYDGKRILSEAAVREMTHPQSAQIRAAHSYGLGWKVETRGGVFSHTGSDGTYVWADPAHEVIGMVLTQTNGATRPRNAFRQLVTAACVEQPPAETGPRSDGFYKDIFMSGGKNLTSRKRLYAAESLGLAYEYYAGSDASWQNQLIIGNAADTNGVLLYPDGSPRFRMIYVNGGAATKHGKSLTQEGRERLRQFHRAGGSYCGSCAGSFLSGRNVDSRSDPREGYLHIFPFNTLNTGIKKTRLKHVIPPTSPLLRYRDFGGDNMVAEVYHNNGNWLRIKPEMEDVKVLARYDHPGHKIDQGAAIWAYRPDDRAGQILNIGCHPEGSDAGERLALTEACFLHALAGVGQPQLKGVLEFGKPRKMGHSPDPTSSPAEPAPAFAKIGDLQYHHFAFDVPMMPAASAEVQPIARPVKIQLSSTENVDLHLHLSRQGPALRRQAEVLDDRPGANKTLQKELTPGRWHVSVFCATSVKTMNDPDAGFHRYIGDRSILNGAAYTISIE